MGIVSAQENDDVVTINQVRDSNSNLPYYDVTIELFQKPHGKPHLEFGDRLIKIKGLSITTATGGTI